MDKNTAFLISNAVTFLPLVWEIFALKQSKKLFSIRRKHRSFLQCCMVHTPWEALASLATSAPLVVLPDNRRYSHCHKYESRCRCSAGPCTRVRPYSSPAVMVLRRQSIHTQLSPLASALPTAFGTLPRCLRKEEEVVKWNKPSPFNGGPAEGMNHVKSRISALRALTVRKDL